MASSHGTENGARFTQTPHLEFTDEGASAVTSIQGRVFAANVERVENAWQTFGPIAGPSRLMNFTLRFRIWYEAAVGVPNISNAGTAVKDSNVVTMFRSEIVFNQQNDITHLSLVKAGSGQHSLLNMSPLYVLIAKSNSVEPVSIDVSALDPDNVTMVSVQAGGWWGIWSPAPFNTQIFTNRANAVVLHLKRCGAGAGCGGDWFQLLASSPLRAQRGDSYVTEFVQLTTSPHIQCNTSAAVLATRMQVIKPPGLVIERGRRLDEPGLLQFALDSTGTAALSVPQAEQKQTMLPLRFASNNTKWSVGLWQRAGYTLGNYGNGTDRWTALGLDADGHAYVPLYIGLASVDVVFGHPVTSDNEDIFIQVTRADTITPLRLNSQATCEVWHVAINNPTQLNVTTILKKAMPINALHVPLARLHIPPGGWLTIPQPNCDDKARRPPKSMMKHIARPTLE
eukprot:SAG31_NODE_1665_length_7585_cov_6.666711_5_plen_454_part_00